MPIPTHVSDEPDAGDRGRALGRARRAELHRTFRAYAGLFDAVGARPERVREWGERALAETAGWAPALAAEIAGLAEGSGLDGWQLGALNGRTEILAAAATTGEGECSTSVVLPGGVAAPRTVQTWDWHDTLREVMLIHSLEPRPGHRVHTFTEFGVVGKIGLNSAGLGVHFNVLRHVADSAEIGVPVHVVARRILDEASSIDEAVALARSARLSASSLLMVVAFDGERGAVRGLELSPAGVAELPPENGVLVHTNHFLDPRLAEGERTYAAESTTADRLAVLRGLADELGAADRTRRARALDRPPLCAHPEPSLPPHQRWESLATISLDLVAGRLDVHPGGPCGVMPETWQETE